MQHAVKRDSCHLGQQTTISGDSRRLLATICCVDIQDLFGMHMFVGAIHTCCAGVISSVGLHTDDEFKAFTPAEGYNKNVTYKNGKPFWPDSEHPLHLHAMISAHSIQMPI